MDYANGQRLRTCRDIYEEQKSSNFEAGLKTVCLRCDKESPKIQIPVLKAIRKNRF